MGFRFLAGRSVAVFFKSAAESLNDGVIGLLPLEEIAPFLIELCTGQRTEV
jgi:hypothetical protein